MGFEPWIVMILGYALWFFLLFLGIVVVRFQAARAGLHVTKFTAAGAELSPFGARVCRAHANMVENFGPLLAIVVAAYVTGQTAVLDPLAYVFLMARVAQSVTHLTSGTPKAMGIRGLFFVVQVLIQVYWIFALLF
jgi:uncharacterized MAPEG superfamily protein